MVVISYVCILYYIEQPLRYVLSNIFKNTINKKDGILQNVQVIPPPKKGKKSWGIRNRENRPKQTKSQT